MSVDIDPGSYNLDPGGLWRCRENPPMRCVHQMSIPRYMSAVLAFGRAHDFSVRALYLLGHDLAGLQPLQGVGARLVAQEALEQVQRPHLAALEHHLDAV